MCGVVVLLIVVAWAVLWAVFSATEDEIKRIEKERNKRP